MSSQVQPEEAQAIREMVTEIRESVVASSVELRDFAEPRRRSHAHLSGLDRRISATMQATSNKLVGPLRGFYKLSLAIVKEVNSSFLFKDLTPPFLIFCFDVGGNPGWLFWERGPALRTIETVICGDFEAEAEDRNFSDSECSIIERLLTTIIKPVAEAFESEISPIRMAQELSELVSLDDFALDADTQRMLIHLSFDGPGGMSDLRIYLPDTHKNEQVSADIPMDVPTHLDLVPLELHAYLGSIDIPLTDLLALEVGDVIPLDLAAGSPLQIFVENRSCAKASWGRYRGNLAVRVEEIAPGPELIDQPDIQ